jgi:hypothetical protein
MKFPKVSIFFASMFMLILTGNRVFAQQDSSYYNLKIGGAVRFNYLYKSWDNTNNKKGGELAYDMFRLEVDADYDHLVMSAQVRFYSNDFGGMLIHHAYVGYVFNNEAKLLLGIHQNPYGLQTYASNNWFFNIGYYVGLEDDYDFGLKYILDKEKYTLNLAFYKNSELPPTNKARYSYDITGTHSEFNQWNAKFEYKFSGFEIGVSTQYGQLEEVATQDSGTQQAYAVHGHATMGRFDFKAQTSYYAIDPAGAEKDIVYMSAYGAQYEVSTEALIHTVGVKYRIPIDYYVIKSLDIYNDFGIINKRNTGHFNSMLNVFGVGVNMNKLYTYVDYALGKNHAWVGPEWTKAFSSGTEDGSWHARFNVNFGYYF